jgi:hypothetical protein
MGQHDVDLLFSATIVPGSGEIGRKMFGVI